MPKRVILDIETCGSNLKRVGPHRYAADADVRCLAYKIDEQPTRLWWPGDPPLAEIATAGTVIAHNAGFDRVVYDMILVRRYGWPAISLERWCCTMARSLTLALPAALGKVAAVLKLPAQKGDKAIVARMAKPGPVTPEDLQKLGDYNKQDVETTYALDRWLPPLSEAEQKLWCLSERINARGFYTDGCLIEKAIAISTAADKAVQAELKQITGGEIETTHQVAKILAWLAARDCVVNDLQKATLSAALRRASLSPEVRRVIELRREAAHASAGKFEALRAWRCHDGRIRGTFRFHGASTGRWSGAGPQPQNFRRETDNTESKFTAMMAGDLTAVSELGPPIEVVGDVARCAICAPPGHRLLIRDFSGIELRILAWIADQHDKVAQWVKFDRSQDRNDHPYSSIARAMGFSGDGAYDAGKRADLAFGYQGGLGAYQNFAPEDDTASEAQIKAYKDAWRARHPQIVQFWYGVDRAAVLAVAQPGREVRYGRLTLQSELRDGNVFLAIMLPSRRKLHYPFCTLITNRFGKPAVSFMDNALITGGWSPCNRGEGAYGGIWTENIVSGIARDLLAAAMTRLEAAGYPVVLHVHDEIACEMPDNVGSVEACQSLVEHLPEWAQ